MTHRWDAKRVKLVEMATKKYSSLSTPPELEPHHRMPFSVLHFEYTVYPIYPTPPLGQDMTRGHFFKWGLTGLNSEFSFS